MVGDEIADGTCGIARAGAPRPLALFDAVRVDYSLRRLVHYTGTDWRDVQPWILLTNYHRYVDQFVRWATRASSARRGRPMTRLVLPGGITIERGELAPRRDGGRSRASRLAPLPDAGLPPHARERRASGA